MVRLLLRPVFVLVELSLYLVELDVKDDTDGRLNILNNMVDLHLVDSLVFFLHELGKAEVVEAHLLRALDTRP